MVNRKFKIIAFICFWIQTGFREDCKENIFGYVRGVLAYYDLWIVFVKFTKIASGRVHHKQ